MVHSYCYYSSSDSYYYSCFILLASSFAIHSFIHNTIMECLLTSRHCAGDAFQEMSMANLDSALMETPLRPIVTLKPKYDHVILCSASLSRLSSLRATSAFLRLVWNGLCETLPIASPGEPQLQLDTGPPRRQGIVFQTSMQAGWWPRDSILADEV